MRRFGLRGARTTRRLALAHHQRWLFAARAGETTTLTMDPDGLPRIRRRLLRTPKPVAHPVVVISGYADPGLYARIVARELRRLTSHDKRDFFVPSFRLDGPIERMSETVQDQLCYRFRPGAIDLVGLSMGGLVSRHVAAAFGKTDPAISVPRIFTLGTPHRGATLADKVAPSEAARQMRPGSKFLATLDEALDRHPVELVAYHMDRDAVIGDGHGAPAGRPAIRLPRRPGEPHLHVMADPIALLDIALRLRGEPPILEAQPDSA